MWIDLLKNLLVSLVIATVSTIIAAKVNELIKNRRWLLPLVFCGVTLVMLLFLNFVNPSGEIQITEIDGQPSAAASESAEIGYRIEVKGYLARLKGPVYVVVKPLYDKFWYIQPPAPATFIGSGTTDWAGYAYLGTPSAGQEEKFVVFAVSTSETHTAGEKLDREPGGLKSNAVFVKRSRLSTPNPPELELKSLPKKQKSIPDNEPVVASIPEKEPAVASFSVPARSANWRRDVLTPTTLQISQGSTIIFKASGRWNVGAGSVGPAGTEAFCECLVAERFGAGFRGLLGALVGKIGQDGTPFLIGTGTTVVSSRTGGVLFLGANDNMGPCDGFNPGSCYYDNAGSLTVQIEIK